MLISQKMTKQSFLTVENKATLLLCLLTNMIFLVLVDGCNICTKITTLLLICYTLNAVQLHNAWIDIRLKNKSLNSAWLNN